MHENKQLFDETIKKNEFLFRFVGLYIKSGIRKPSEKLKLRLRFIFNFIWLNVDFCGVYWWLIDGIRKGKDFLSLTFMAPCGSFGALANIKAFSLLFNEKNVHQLIDNIRELEEKQYQHIDNIKKHEIIHKEVKFLNLVVKVFNIVYTFLIVAFALSPLTLMAFKYVNTKEMELLLPFDILYPFDCYNIKYWPFVYLYQIRSECITSSSIWSSDNFFFTCCIHLRIQFRLLHYEIERLIPVQNIQKRAFHADAQFSAKFKKLMEWHNDIIKSHNLLEIIYCKATLLNFMLSSLIICLTGFNVTVRANTDKNRENYYCQKYDRLWNTKDLTVIVTFISFFCMSLLQIFFLCFFADLVTTSSTNVSNAVYNSQWYLADSNIRKLLLIVLTRSQKPCKLTAYGFADVNLNSFMRVLSTSWSYFALLQTMYGD